MKVEHVKEKQVKKVKKKQVKEERMRRLLGGFGSCCSDAKVEGAAML